MKLYAISDLHIGFEANRKALEKLTDHADDWLIVGGDTGETEEHLLFCLDVLGRRFAQLIWVPGNHELWTVEKRDLRGEAKYQRLVELCEQRGVLTPESPYRIWAGEVGEHLITPLFLLYDYTFHPDGVPTSRAVEWAAASGVMCADESLLHPDPYPSRSAWCHVRCRETAARLDQAIRTHDCPLVMVKHFPLMRRLATLPAIPRFEVWCGTTLTEDWHRRYRAAALVSGHLHVRRSDVINGARCEEVSLGYPERQWRNERGVDGYLRQILPDPTLVPIVLPARNAHRSALTGISDRFAPEHARSYRSSDLRLVEALQQLPPRRIHVWLR